MYLCSAVAVVLFLRYTVALTQCFERINSKPTKDIELGEKEQKGQDSQGEIDERKPNKVLENGLIFFFEVALSGFIFPQGLTLNTSPVLLSWGNIWSVKTDHVFYCILFLMFYDTFTEFLIIPTSVETAMKNHLFFYGRLLWCFNCVMLMCCIWKVFFFRDLLINLYFYANSVLSQNFSFYEKPNCIFTLTTMNYLVNPMKSRPCFQHKVSCSKDEATVTFLTLYEWLGNNLLNFLVLLSFFSLVFVPFVLWMLVDHYRSLSQIVEPIAVTISDEKEN